jgi:hypothetical protein
MHSNLWCVSHQVDEVRVRLILSGAVPIVFSHLNGTFSSSIFNAQDGKAVRRNAEKREAVAKLERECIRTEKLILKRYKLHRSGFLVSHIVEVYNKSFTIH